MTMGRTAGLIRVREHHRRHGHVYQRRRLPHRHSGTPLDILPLYINDLQREPVADHLLTNLSIPTGMIATRPPVGMLGQ